MYKTLPNVTDVRAVEVLDSRGNPTVKVKVTLSDGVCGVASAPSGASTGKYEAHEKRDIDAERYGGRGVLSAVGAVNTAIAEYIIGKRIKSQAEFDKMLVTLDGTENKSRLGANAILPVSMAYARACAAHFGMELYEYLGGILGRCSKMPCPMMNVLNGGAHSKNNIDIQEFMIVPVGISDYGEKIRACAEIYHTLGRLLSSRGHITSVGDEGGFAPMLGRDEEAIEYILEAAERAGYGGTVKVALDAAASEWHGADSDGEVLYRLPKRGIEYDTESLVSYFTELSEKYPIISIEDGVGEEDRDGWKKLTDALGDKVMLVGDDVFVTNKSRVLDGIRGGYANALLVKPNQAGTVTETVEALLTAKNAGYRVIVSHRSGETDDTFISDLGVAVGADYIKAGAPARGERTAKYNRLTEICSGI